MHSCSMPRVIHKYELFFSVRPTSLTLSSLQTDEDPKEIDFFTKQARLQIEARMALAQAKDMAHMQMEVRRHVDEFISSDEIRNKQWEHFCIEFLTDGTSETKRVADHKYHP